jgi:hypothetical protein
VPSVAEAAGARASEATIGTTRAASRRTNECRCAISIVLSAGALTSRSVTVGQSPLRALARTLCPGLRVPNTDLAPPSPLGPFSACTQRLSCVRGSKSRLFGGSIAGLAWAAGPEDHSPRAPS